MSGKFKIKNVRKLECFLNNYGLQLDKGSLNLAYYFNHSVTVIDELIIFQYCGLGINVLTGEQCYFTPRETDTYRGFIWTSSGIRWVTHDDKIEPPITTSNIIRASELMVRGCQCRTREGCNLTREYNITTQHHRCSHFEEYQKGDGEYILDGVRVITPKEVIPLPFVANGWVWGNGHFLVFGENGIYDVTTKRMLLEYTKGIICGISRGVVLIMVDKGTTNGWHNVEWYTGILEEKPRKPKQGECAVCFNAAPKMMAYNCGHAVVCRACDKMSACIICGVVITQRIEIFSR